MCTKEDKEGAVYLLRAWTALGVYLAITWLLLAAVLAVGLLLGAGTAAGWAIAPLSMVFVIVVTFAYSNAAPVGEALLDADSAGAPIRYHWLDNAKVVLISLVVIGHSAVGFMGQGAFLGLDVPRANWLLPAGYCGLALFKPVVVPLFYFISGFFSAVGRARKGAGSFLRSSFWRLAPPYFLFWLVVNPLNSFVAFALTQPSHAKYSYFPNSAATWFLSWLLVFQSGFVLTDSLPAMPLPSFGRLMLVGFGVAIMQLGASTVCALAQSSLGFGEMPMAGPGGDGFFNALGFVGGLLAKTNEWLAQPLPRGLVRACWYYALVVAAAVVAFFVLTLGPGAPAHALAGTLPWLLAFFGLQIPLGPYCVCVGVVAVDLLQRRCDFETPLARFLARGAFAVYLLQYWAVTATTYAYILLLERTAGVHVEFVNSTQGITSGSGPGGGANDGELFAGFLFVAGISLPVAFLIGGLLKMVPVLGSYL